MSSELNTLFAFKTTMSSTSYLSAVFLKQTDGAEQNIKWTGRHLPFAYVQLSSMVKIELRGAQ